MQSCDLLDSAILFCLHNFLHESSHLLPWLNFLCLLLLIFTRLDSLVDQLLINMIWYWYLCIRNSHWILLSYAQKLMTSYHWRPAWKSLPSNFFWIPVCTHLRNYLPPTRDWVSSIRQHVLLDPTVSVTSNRFAFIIQCMSAQTPLCHMQTPWMTP